MLVIILGTQNLRLSKYRKTVFLLNLENRDQQSTQKRFVKRDVMSSYFCILIPLAPIGCSYTMC